MTDFWLDDHFDLVVKEGDWAISADSASQDIRSMLNTAFGEWLFWPPLGVGVKSFLLSDEEDSAALQRVIRLNLKFLKLDIDLSVEVLNSEIKCFVKEK